MEDEDEDIYAPDEGLESTDTGGPRVKDDVSGSPQINGDEEEEYEEDDSDSDIDIITERKDGNKPEPPQTQRINAIRNVPQRTASPSSISKAQTPSALKVEPIRKASPFSRPGSSYPGVKTSKIDIDAKPIYEPNGKPISEIDMDADFPEDDKPWRRPGTDMTDYFNYGFDEFSWASYCLKQDSLRKEISDQKKQMEEMQSFLGMPGGMPVPGMPGPAGTQAGMPPLGGPGDLPPEMQQMMQQMMSQGMDPSQMDFSTFTQMMQGAPGGPGGMGGQGFGQQGQNQQQMGYGYGATGVGTGNTGGNGRNQGVGRGQNRRNW